MIQLKRNQGGRPRQRKEVNETILDNLNFVQVRFLPLWCKGEALPPSGRLTINRVTAGMKGGNSKPNRESRPAQLSMDSDRTYDDSSSPTTSQRRLPAWSKMGMVKQTQRRLCKGWMQRFVIQTAPQSNPANSKILNSTANEVQERWKDPSALQSTGVGVNRMLLDGLRDCLRSLMPWGKPKDMLT
jgi:hypothetical protein